MTVNDTGELFDKDWKILSKIPLEIREFWESNFIQGDRYRIYNFVHQNRCNIWKNEFVILAVIQNNHIKYNFNDTDFCSEKQILKMIQLKLFI